MILSTGLLTVGGCAASPDEDGEEEQIGASELPIRHPTPADSGELLSMVSLEISTASGLIGCSGTVIGPDIVLTAAHCFCTEDFVGGNDCVHEAEVIYRRNPAALGTPPRRLNGTAIIHPDYNPSWTEGQFEHDLAIVKVDGVSPPHAAPVLVPDAYLPAGTIVKIAGFGRTGSDCTGPAGSLNYDTDDIEDYEDGHRIMAFDDFVWCPGDSGGAILDAVGNLYGVISMHTPWTQKAIATGSETEWIESTMCEASGWNECEMGGRTCNCSARASDILWRSVDGDNAIWPDAGAPGFWFGALDGGWQVAGIGDFDADHRSDILWRSIHGDNVIWPGGSPPGFWISPLNNGWQVAGIGDFDADQASDILWRSIHGDNAIWPAAQAPGFWIEPLNDDWQVAGIGDFDTDRRSDILWRSAGGDNVIWPAAQAAGFWIEPLNDDWQVAGIGVFAP